MQKTINIPIFHHKIWLTDWEDAKKYVEDVSCYDALCYIGYRQRVCFCCSEIAESEIAHESLHLANFILRRCMIFVDAKEDEIAAYLMQFIFEKLKPILEKENKIKQRNKANEKTTSTMSKKSN